MKQQQKKDKIFKKHNPNISVPILKNKHNEKL